MEGAAAVAVAAGDAGVGLYLQITVVVRRQGVPGLGQIIILVDEPDVQPAGQGWQWLQYTHVPSISRGVRELMAA